MQTTRTRTFLAGTAIWVFSCLAYATPNAPGDLAATAASPSSARVIKATAGEDMNQNGVRDDVELFLINNIKPNKVHDAYRDLAKQLQRVIVEVPTGKATATSIAKDIERAMVAVGKVTAFFSEAPIKVHHLERLVFNTSERKSAYASFTAAVYRGQ